jgi:VWFA-related protein
MRSFRRIIILGFAAASLVSSAALRIAHGTDAAPAPVVPPSTYVEKEVSELVLIETYVTDASGKPVIGLTRDDFILEVGGLRRPILSVDYQQAGAQAGSATTAVAPATGGAPAGASAWPRRVVLFFEDDISSPIGMTAARIAASRFVEDGLASSDQVAVAAHGERLRLLTDFTTDRSTLQKAITASIKTSARASDFWQEVAQRRVELMRDFDPRVAKTLCEEEKYRLARALKAVETVVASLAAWRGYKAVVYMGNGVPESPYEDVWKTFAQMEARHPANFPAFFPTICRLDEEIKDLSRAASAAGVTIHTVQTWGLTAGPAYHQQIASDRTNSLKTLALNTAGLSTGTNDLLLALQQIEEASRTFYQLAYIPQEPADGRYRHVVVRCRRKGAQLRYRKGFVRLPPDEARTRRIEAAYLFPEMSADLGMEIAVASGPGDGKDQVVDIVVHLPIEKVLFLPQEAGETARLTVGLLVVDEMQRTTMETSRSMTIRRPGAAGDVTALDLYCRTRLPAARQTITAVVSDDQADTVGGTRSRVVADPSPGPGAHGLSLYSLAERSLWVEVPTSPAGRGGDPRMIEPTVGPVLKSTFVVGEPIVAGFRLTRDNAPAALRVAISSGAVIVRTRTIDLASEGAGGTTKVPLPVEGLAAGEYVFSIDALGEGRDTAIGSLTFRIIEADERPGP